MLEMERALARQAIKSQTHLEFHVDALPCLTTRSSDYETTVVVLKTLIVHREIKRGKTITMATPAKEKNMSSRLLTMKFMQRASASASQSAPSTPDQRPSKRPRLSEPFLYAQPSQSAQSSVSADQQRVQEALAEEDRKRQVALDRQAADAGDTKWSLEGATESPLRGLRVVSAGYTAIDTGRSARDAIYVGEEEEETEARPRLSGRKSFGKFNKVLEVSLR